MPPVGNVIEVLGTALGIDLIIGTSVYYERGNLSSRIVPISVRRTTEDSSTSCWITSRIGSRVDIIPVIRRRGRRDNGVAIDLEGVINRAWTGSKTARTSPIHSGVRDVVCSFAFGGS